MELTEYDIIRGIVTTSKSFELRKKLGQITFRVSPWANKTQVRNAIEKIWNVKVERVCVISRRGKNKVIQRRPYTSSDIKKAVVTLKSGYTIDLPEYYETMGAPLATQAGSEKE